MGCIRERKTKRGKVFDAEVKRKGHKPVQKTFDRKTDARQWIADTEADLRSGRYQPQVEAAKHTVAEAIERYIREELPNKQKAAVFIIRKK